jgi:hypothetical protein
VTAIAEAGAKPIRPTTRSIHLGRSTTYLAAGVQALKDSGEVDPSTDVDATIDAHGQTARQSGRQAVLTAQLGRSMRSLNRR